MLYLYFHYFENRLILKQPASVSDLQRYVTIQYYVTSELWSDKSEQNCVCLYSGNAKQM